MSKKLWLGSADQVRRAVAAGHVVRLVEGWMIDAVEHRGPIVIDYGREVRDRVSFGVQAPPPDCLTFFDEPKKSRRAPVSAPAAPAPVVSAKVPSRTHLALRSYAMFVVAKMEKGGHK